VGDIYFDPVFKLYSNLVVNIEKIEEDSLSYMTLKASLVDQAHFLHFHTMAQLPNSNKLK